MYVDEQLPLEVQQQILLDEDFDNARPTLIEEWLARRRDMEDPDY